MNHPYRYHWKQKSEKKNGVQSKSVSFIASFSPSGNANVDLPAEIKEASHQTHYKTASVSFFSRHRQDRLISLPLASPDFRIELPISESWDSPVRGRQKDWLSRRKAVYAAIEKTTRLKDNRGKKSELPITIRTFVC